MTTMVLTPAFPRLPRADAAVVRQLARYGVVGVLGTTVSALLYLLFRVWWDAVPANLAALVLSTVASTEANRRFTFRGAPTDRVREYLQNAGTVAFYAVYSSAVLLLLDALVDEPTALQESVTVAAASVLGGLARFAVLRNWVFGDESRQGGRAKIGQSGAMIRFLPTRRLLAAAAALGGLLLSTAASCGPGTASAPATTPAVPAPAVLTPAVPTTAPSRTATQPGDDNGGGRGGGDDSGGGGGGRRGGGGCGEGEGRSGDG
jgi:putative flippase GtrA